MRTLLALLLALSVSPPLPAVRDPAVRPGPVTIAADIAGYGLVFVRARVNRSEPIWFAVDSGATFPFIIDTRRAAALGLRLEGGFTRKGGAGPGTYDVQTTHRVEIKVGGVEFVNQTAAVIALRSLEAIAGRRLDGVIGRDLFIHYVVAIDYRSQKISLYDPQSYTYTGTGESVPLTMRGDYLLIPASVEMPDRPQVSGQFLVDTGGGLVTAALTTPFALSHGFPAATQTAVLDRSLWGLGGATRLLVTRARSLALGKLVIQQPVIYVSQDKGGALASPDFDGVIGGEILRKFTVIFDVERRRLIMEPNPEYALQTEYDMSGMRLHASGSDLRTFTVFQVIENSPASAAGLREGDVLAAVDGVPASRFSLDALYQMLKRPGRSYQLNVRRGGRSISVTIRTERLI